jgi:hypothetical protein
MAANRKLQQQVDSTLKKVDEGIDEFDVLFSRVDPGMNQNQRVCLFILDDGIFVGEMPSRPEAGYKEAAEISGGYHEVDV